MPLYIILLILMIALLGATLSPLALLIKGLPLGTSGVLDFLANIRTFIANFLLWFFFCLVVLMGLSVLKERWANRKLGKNSEKRNIVTERSAYFNPPLKAVVSITAYDHCASIEEMVKDFIAQERVVAVIVVDNNSSDNTAQIASSAGAKVVREFKQGYGYACIRGLEEALSIPEAEIIVLTEGDGTFSADDMAKFRAYIHQVDMVVGNRTTSGLVEIDSQMDNFFTWGNIFVGALLQLRYWNPRFLGRVRLTDVGCTYRAIRRDALQRILPSLRVGGDHFSPHMILVALANNLSVIEIPITFRRRIGHSKGAGQSFIRGFKIGLGMIWHILTYAPKNTSNPIVSRVGEPVLLPKNWTQK